MGHKKSEAVESPSEDLVVLQHERNRGPGETITVNGHTYELDEQGNVEVSPEDAAKMQLGRKWRPPEYWDARRDQIAAATPPPSSPAGRRVRTRQELLATAYAEGVPVEVKEPAESDSEETSEVQEAPEEKVIKADDPIAREVAARAEQRAKAQIPTSENPDPEPEPIVVSEDMSKAELLQLAADVGVNVKSTMTKAQILGYFEAKAKEQ